MAATSLTFQFARDDKSGEYKRSESVFRDRVAPGTRFPPEAGRYHLHVSLACPWAAGVLTALHMKGLENVVSHSVVHPTWQRTKPDDDADTHTGWVYKAPGDAPLLGSTGRGSYICDAGNKPDAVTGATSIRCLPRIAWRQRNSPGSSP